MDTITYSSSVQRGISNAGLYLTSKAPVTPAVPEPSTWATMIMGFALVGGAMRAAKGRAPRITYA